jgi:hypothetical protein
MAMKTKPIQAIFLASILALVWCSAVWGGERPRKGTNKKEYKQTERSNKSTYNVRRNKQASRISKGVRKGDITRKESRRLDKEQRRIDRTYRRAVSDGHLSRLERQRLHKMRDRAGRHIYRARNNHAAPKRYRHHPGLHNRRPTVHHHPRRQYYRSYPTKTGSSNDYKVSGAFTESGWRVAISIGGFL